jgi:hypothetical protein
VTGVAVLGTGMGACGAVHRLAAEGLAPVMYDMNAYHGAHTTSFEHPGGFVFDIGPHISYTKNPRIQARCSPRASMINTRRFRSTSTTTGRDTGRCIRCNCICTVFLTSW